MFTKRISLKNYKKIIFSNRLDHLIVITIVECSNIHLVYYINYALPCELFYIAIFIFFTFLGQYSNIRLPEILIQLYYCHKY